MLISNKGIFFYAERGLYFNYFSSKYLSTEPLWGETTNPLYTEDEE